jgi:hypothetical protein
MMWPPWYILDKVLNLHMRGTPCERSKEYHKKRMSRLSKPIWRVSLNLMLPLLKGVAPI